MPYIKKTSPTKSYLKSKLYQKIQNQSAAIAKNPSFWAEFNKIKKDCRIIFHPYFEREVKTDADYKRYFEKRKKYEAFLTKWGISRVLNGKPWMKSTVEIGTDSKNFPFLRIISKEATRQDVEDQIPLLMEIKNHKLGSPAETRGRKKTMKERNDLIRAEFIKRRPKEKSKDIISSLAVTHEISHIQAERIVYNQVP